MISATPLFTGAWNSASCRPSSTDGNGGPYPGAPTSNCLGSRSVEVDIVNDPQIGGGFSPSNITISRGASVRWVWKAGGHNLYPFYNGIEDTGFTFTKTFRFAGDFPYSCQVHPGQNGIIHVQ